MEYVYCTGGNSLFCSIVSIHFDNITTYFDPTYLREVVSVIALLTRGGAQVNRIKILT